MGGRDEGRARTSFSTKASNQAARHVGHALQGIVPQSECWAADDTACVLPLSEPGTWADAGYEHCVSSATYAMTCVSCCEAVHRQTELFARWLLENPGGKTSFNTAEEADAVDEVFNSALAGLKPADRDLKIVQGIRGLLRAGIAMHHSGLLPILKEVIEILFQEGLVKVRATHAIHTRMW